MKYILFADEYGGDGCDWTVTLCEGTYEECFQKQDRLTQHCNIQYSNYRIVSEDEVNGVCQIQP